MTRVSCCVLWCLPVTLCRLRPGFCQPDWVLQLLVAALLARLTQIGCTSSAGLPAAAHVYNSSVAYVIALAYSLHGLSAVNSVQ